MKAENVNRKKNVLGSNGARWEEQIERILIELCCEYWNSFQSINIQYITQYPPSLHYSIGNSCSKPCEESQHQQSNISMPSHIHSRNQSERMTLRQCSSHVLLFLLRSVNFNWFLKSTHEKKTSQTRVNQPNNLIWRNRKACSCKSYFESLMKLSTTPNPSLYRAQEILEAFKPRSHERAKSRDKRLANEYFTLSSVW